MFNFDYEGTMDGECMELRCNGWNKPTKPRATYYNTTRSKWVCFECAQKANAEALQGFRRFQNKTLDGFKRPCITSQERVIQVLSGAI